MDKAISSSSCNKHYSSEDPEVRKGPWTMEEDLILMNYIANHGEGVWNNIAKCAGLKRTGKSCRLRWLNYLRPDVRRGNISPDEEMLIIDLHSRWGNRWSKIAKQLPGRTDNEIKNYWRTRIQKKFKFADQANEDYIDQINQEHQLNHMLMTAEESSSSTRLMSCIEIGGCSATTSVYNEACSSSTAIYVEGNDNSINAFAGPLSSGGCSDEFWNVEELWSM